MTLHDATARPAAGDAPAGWSVQPPPDLPPGRTVVLPGRGEVFVRDSGGAGPTLLLLHGWLVSADLNWYATFAALVDAGYRVLAIDHRGHGRGLRTPAPFRLADCAADAAALVAALDCGPAIAVGYSMGGPIAMLAARDFPAQIEGMVLCATSSHWRDTRYRLFFALSLRPLSIVLGLSPLTLWLRAVRRELASTGGASSPCGPHASWLATELTRGSPRDLIEAGRELRRFDARPWLPALRTAAVVVVTGHDLSVRGANQHDLADRLQAPRLRAPGGHFAVSRESGAFNEALLQAVRLVREQIAARADRLAAAQAQNV